jgi:hypothetical protein
MPSLKLNPYNPERIENPKKKWTRDYERMLSARGSGIKEVKDAGFRMMKESPLGQKAEALGFGSAGTFAGPKALKANFNLKHKTEDMLTQGEPRSVVFAKTGWFKGMDRRSKFEIDDSESRLLPAAQDIISGKEYKLKDFLRHDELYENYPFLREIPIKQKTLSGGTRGSVNPETNQITLEAIAPDKRGTILHELQHIIQRHENFARGTNMASGWRHKDARFDAQLENAIRSVGYNLHPSFSRPSFIEFSKMMGFKSGSTNKKLLKEYMDLYKVDEGNKLFNQASDTAKYQIYKKFAGEIEARDVASRKDLPLMLRRAKHPKVDKHAILSFENPSFYDFLK